MRIRNTLVAVIVAAGLTAGGVNVAESSTVQLPARATFMRTPCPAEDATDCAWNARTMGNGHGASFYAVTVKLLGRDGRRIGAVSCHYLVKPRLDTRYSSCQVTHRRAR